MINNLNKKKRTKNIKPLSKKMKKLNLNFKTKIYFTAQKQIQIQNKMPYKTIILLNFNLCR